MGCILPLSSIWLTSPMLFLLITQAKNMETEHNVARGWQELLKRPSKWAMPSRTTCKTRSTRLLESQLPSNFAALSKKKKDPTNDSFGFQTPLKLLKTVQQSLSHNVTLTVTGIKQRYYIKGMHEKDQFSHCPWINNRKLIFFLSISEWEIRTLCEQIPLAQI